MFGTPIRSQAGCQITGTPILSLLPRCTSGASKYTVHFIASAAASSEMGQFVVSVFSS